jgi:hypothetical protein
MQHRGLVVGPVSLDSRSPSAFAASATAFCVREFGRRAAFSRCRTWQAQGLHADELAKTGRLFRSRRQQGQPDNEAIDRHRTVYRSQSAVIRLRGAGAPDVPQQPLIAYDSFNPTEEVYNA